MIILYLYLGIREKWVVDFIVFFFFIEYIVFFELYINVVVGFFNLSYMIWIIV